MRALYYAVVLTNEVFEFQLLGQNVVDSPEPLLSVPYCHPSCTLAFAWRCVIVVSDSVLGSVLSVWPDVCAYCTDLTCTCAMQARCRWLLLQLF